MSSKPKKYYQAHRLGSTLSILLLAFHSGSALATSQQGFDGLLLAQSYGSTTSRKSSQQYGPVRKRENLWVIAKPFRPPYTTMSQTVMAIFYRNPDAFHHQDINRLKTGAILEIPTESEMQATNHRQAYAEINRQIAVYESKLTQRKKTDTATAGLASTTQDTQVDPVSVGLNDAINVELETIESIKAELVEDEVVAAVEPVTETNQVETKPAKPVDHDDHDDHPLFRYSYDISIADDDNVRRAQESNDIRSDLITSITLNARGGQPLDALSLISYGGSVTYENFDVFDDLNNLNFNVNAKYRFSTSAGFTSPVYSLGVKLGGIETESDMRDSSTFSASFDMNKWVTTTINMTTGLGYNLRESRSEVFDTSEGRAFINFDLNLTKRSLIYTTYTFIRGDIVSSATPRLAIINAAEVIESDDAFGGFTTNQFAYRLDAESQVLTLGYNHILTRSVSMDLSYRYIDSEAIEDDEIYYDRTIIRASLLGRF